MTGSLAMLIGTALLFVGTAYVALPGDHATANEPPLMTRTTKPDEATLVPALDAAQARANNE
jgi:hypothetical protein